MRPLVLWGILLTAAGVSAYDWSFRVDDPIKQERLDTHHGIVERTARAPDRYRILVPYVLDLPIRTLTQVMPYERAFGRVYAAFYWLAITVMLYTLFLSLRTFFTTEQALVGVLVAASTLPMALRYHAYSPYSLLEPTFFALALLWIREERRVRLALLMLVATLNRETGIFIVFFFLAVAPLDRPHVRSAAMLLTIWAATFWGLRWYAGDAPRFFDLQTTWVGNTASLGQVAIAATSWMLLLGAFWLYAAMGISRAPAFVRRTALVLPVYVLTILVWGTWVEVRLWLPMYPVILPLALSYLFTPTARPHQS